MSREDVGTCSFMGEVFELNDLPRRYIVMIMMKQIVFHVYTNSSGYELD